jgi:hypothetical protein
LFIGIPTDAAGRGSDGVALAITKAIKYAFYCAYFMPEGGDAITSHARTAVVVNRVCIMLQEITHNKLNLAVPSQDMRFKRRLLLVLIVVIVVIWLTSLGRRGMEFRSRNTL